jgi:hypothetical protein
VAGWSALSPAGFPTLPPPAKYRGLFDIVDPQLCSWHHSEVVFILSNFRIGAKSSIKQPKSAPSSLLEEADSVSTVSTSA